jgi:hypothetical protein
MNQRIEITSYTSLNPNDHRIGVGQCIDRTPDVGKYSKYFGPYHVSENSWRVIVKAPDGSRSSRYFATEDEARLCIADGTAEFLRDAPGVEGLGIHTDPTRGGWVYVVAVVPDIDLRRLKIGFTKNRIRERLVRFRTSCPTAIPLALWDAPQSAERKIHRMVPGRIGYSEVFHVKSVSLTLLKIDSLIGPRLARQPQPEGHSRVKFDHQEYRVAVFPDGQYAGTLWRACVLEVDIASEGASAFAALEGIERAFAVHDEETRSLRFVQSRPPAGAEIHQMWERGSPLGRTSIGMDRWADVRLCK